jgi:putative flippase GtrA
MAKKTKNRKLVIQFVEYMVSGGVYFWVAYFLVIILNDYFQHDLGWTRSKSVWWASTIGNIGGWSINFVLQRFWVFNNKSLNKHKTEVTGRYILITLVDWVLNNFILIGLTGVGIPLQVGQFISSGFFTIWNWFWYRLWVFPEHMKKHRTIVTPARLAAHRAHGHLGYHRASK